MAITVVQSGDSGATSIASGTAWNLPANVSGGSTVIMAIRVANSAPPNSVAGLGASWASLSNAQRGSFASNISWWYAPNVTAGLAAITPTNPGSVTYFAAAWELNGNATPVTGGAANIASNATGTLTVSGLAAGEFVGVACLFAGTPTTSPTSPWSLYNKNLWLESNVNGDVATQTTTGSSNQTATWTHTGGGSWALAGIIVPASATPTFGGTMFPMIAGA